MLNRNAIVASLAALALTATAAYAGNGAGPNKSASSISPPIVMSSGTAGPSTASGPSFGDTITFNVSTTQTGNPFVNLTCYQNRVLVANDWAAFWPDNKTFVLSSPAWTSGAADCTANLVGYVSSTRYKVLASTSFHVDA
jgi:hypothetical protein